MAQTTRENVLCSGGFHTANATSPSMFHTFLGRSKVIRSGPSSMILLEDYQDHDARMFLIAHKVCDRDRLNPPRCQNCTVKSLSLHCSGFNLSFCLFLCPQSCRRPDPTRFCLCRISALLLWNLWSCKQRTKVTWPSGLGASGLLKVRNHPSFPGNLHYRSRPQSLAD